MKIDTMLDTPFSAWPAYTAEEIEAVGKVLESNKVNYWTGQECRLFEREFARAVECEYGVAVANGTLALDLAFKALGLGAGDEVIVTSRTFLASVSSIISIGAKPVFADVDAQSQNITAETVAAVLSERTKAILCVHLAGWPCDMDPLLTLARERGLWVVEDCAQAHGARYNGRAVGSLGDVAAWSFCQDKIITTGGEGGMLTTQSREIMERAWSYKDHGKSWQAVHDRQHPPGFRWLHESFGTNWRLTEMQAAIGRIQLRRLPVWRRQRQNHARALSQMCRNINALRVPSPPKGVEHAYYKYYVFVIPELLHSGWSRDRIIDEINARGVPCQQGSCSEVYLEKAFEGTEYRPANRLPTARALGATSLMFLVHPTLTAFEIEKTCRVVREVMALASQSEPESLLLSAQMALSR